MCIYINCVLQHSQQAPTVLPDWLKTHVFDKKYYTYTNTHICMYTNTVELLEGVPIKPGDQVLTASYAYRREMRW